MRRSSRASFAHLLSAASRALALERLRRALRPGGLLVLDLPNFPRILAHYRPPPAEERTWGDRRIVRRREHRVDAREGRFTTVDHDLVSAFGQEPMAFSKMHVYAIVDPAVHAQELAAAGFGDVRLFPSFEAREPTTTPGRRLIYLARPSPAR
jgi:SAM-dependent methyltransferase